MTTTPPANATPLPPVSVTGNQPQAPAQPVQAAPAPQPAPAPTVAQPVQAPATTASTNSGASGPPFVPGYQASTLGVGRIVTPLLDTPQTVNVVTQQVIREQNVGTVRDALRNVAGVTFRAGEGGNQGDTPYIRGFSAQNDIFRDAVRDPGWYTRDAFAVDAVEVYKGPASVLFGRGSTGGVINLISKFPFERNVVEGTITGNTGWGARATVDANGQINDNIWGRVVAMTQDYHTPGRDNIGQNRYGISPSFVYKAGDTKITAAYILQHDDNVPDYGIPFTRPDRGGIPRFVSPVPRSNWYGILGGPNPDVELVTAQVGTVKVEHNITNDFKITNITRLNDVNRLQRNVFPEPNNTVPPPWAVNQLWTPNRAQVLVKNTQIVNQTDILMHFWTGPWLEHKVAAGFDLTRESRDFLRNNFAGMAPTNFLDPDPWRWGGVALAPTANQLLYGVAQNTGVYIADQIKITKWFEVLGSWRYDEYTFHQDAPVADPIVQHLERTDKYPSWRVGGGRPSDRKDERLRDARHVVQPVGRQPVDLRHHRGGRAQSPLDRAGRDADHGNRREGRGAQRQAHAANRRVQHRENQSARAEPGQQHGHGPRRCGDGPRMGGERRRVSDRPMATDRQLRLYACAHHQDDDPDPAQCRIADHPAARLLDLDDVRSDEGFPGRRRRLLPKLGLGRHAIGCALHAREYGVHTGLVAVRSDGGLQDQPEGHGAIQHLQPDGQALLRVRRTPTGRCRHRAACSH